METLIINEIKLKVLNCKNTANTQAEIFKKRGWESSQMCSRAMATAYQTVLDKIEESLSGAVEIENFGGDDN